jgi:hypothetical protein
MPLLKPFAETLTLYVPAGKASTLYRPWPSVTAENVWFVVWLVIVTVAPGIAAPLGSVIFPSIRPPAACATSKGIESTVAIRMSGSRFVNLIEYLAKGWIRARSQAQAG